MAPDQVTPDAHELIERQREKWSRKPWIISNDIQRNGRHCGSCADRADAGAPDQG